MGQSLVPRQLFSPFTDELISPGALVRVGCAPVGCVGSGRARGPCSTGRCSWRCDALGVPSGEEVAGPVEKWAEGGAEAGPRLSNSGAENRLVSLTTEMKSARRPLGVGFVCLQRAGTRRQERRSFLYPCSSPVLKTRQLLLYFKNIINVPGGTATSVTPSTLASKRRVLPCFPPHCFCSLTYFTSNTLITRLRRQ